MSTPENPWLVQSMQASHPGCAYVTADDRVCKIIASTDLAWLRRVLTWPDNQLTVRQAAARRIRRLTRPTRPTH
jgi:hypothetical protein